MMIGQRIAARLDRFEEVFVRRGLEPLAWMLVEGLLDIKAAMPKRTIDRREHRPSRLHTPC